MSFNFEDYTGLNGTYLNTIYICENDDIYIPFDVETFKTKDTNVLTNCNYFIQNYTTKNILIDSRLIKTICYISNIIDDILIYNVNTNEIISYSRYVIDKMGTVLNIEECKQILNLYVIITFFIKINWDCGLALRCIGKIKNKIIYSSLYLPYIIDYIEELNKKSSKLQIVKKMKYIDMISEFKMKDGIKKINESIEDILYSLQEINKETHFIDLIAR